MKLIWELRMVDEMCGVTVPSQLCREELRPMTMLLVALRFSTEIMSILNCVLVNLV